MEKTKSTPLTPEQIASIDALAGLPDEEIDTSDIPEITDLSGARRGLLTARAWSIATPGREAVDARFRKRDEERFSVYALRACRAAGALYACLYARRCELERQHGGEEPSKTRCGTRLLWMLRQGAKEEKNRAGTETVSVKSI